MNEKNNMHIILDVVETDSYVLGMWVMELLNVGTPT
jgi:hypothetical protein